MKGWNESPWMAGSLKRIRRGTFQSSHDKALVWVTEVSLLLHSHSPHRSTEWASCSDRDILDSHF